MGKRGRKPNLKPMERVNSIIGRTQKEALDYVSQNENLSISILIENSITEYLQKYYGKLLEKEGICIN